jgi:SpoVK/Ycf46/Vps4 family AAA+-type ATPase
MAARYRESYQFEGGLEQAVLDLVRVGSAGHGSGVRQLASRLVRSVPPGVTDAGSFRAGLQDALAAGPKSPGLRIAKTELPTEEGTSHRLVSVDAVPGGDGLVLETGPMSQLAEVVQERERADDLARAGVGLTRTLLLSGPPGVGKTMAARWLASQIEVPLVVVDLAAVVSSYLGSSGRNIRAAMEYATSGPCVFLLDEFDALAKRRDDDTDIGELKRIVNVVLVELDRWPDSSLLVAATNHPQLLDSAVGRRFDRHIEFALPALAERRSIFEYLSKTDLADDPILDVAAAVTKGLSGSDITRIWNSAQRRAVLDDRGIDETLLLNLVQTIASGPERDELWALLARRLKMSNRQIASLAGVSHPTVASALRRSKVSNG